MNIFFSRQNVHQSRTIYYRHTPHLAQEYLRRLYAYSVLSRSRGGLWQSQPLAAAAAAAYYCVSWCFATVGACSWNSRVLSSAWMFFLSAWSSSLLNTVDINLYWAKDERYKLAVTRRDFDVGYVLTSANIIQTDAQKKNNLWTLKVGLQCVAYVSLCIRCDPISVL